MATTTEENELISERLLGWRRAVRGTLSGCQFWDTEPTQLRTPTFTTWDEAGLILEAFAPLGGCVVMYVPHHENHWSCSPPGGRDVPTMAHDTGPLAIRAAALAWLEATK